MNDPAGKLLPPHSEEGEQALLGSILINPHVLDDLKDIHPHDFYLVRHQWIFDAMVTLHRRQEAIDLLTIGAELRSREQLQDVGGVAYISSMVNDTPTSIHYRTYAVVIRESARQRQALELASQIAQGAASGNADLIRDAVQQINALMAAKDNIEETMRQHSVHVRDLKHLPPVSWLIPGELPERGITMLFGPSGIGKSFVALDYALKLGKTRKIVYVAAEGQAGYHVRTAAWAKHNKTVLDDLTLFFFLKMLSLLDGKESDAFIDIYRPLQPDLVVVDTMSLCMLPGDENSARDIAQFIKAAQKIQQALQCALLFVHHTGKEGKDYRGSSALRANCDVMIRLLGDDDVITVECTKSKDAAAFPRRYIKLLPVVVEDGSSQVVVEAGQVEQTAADPLTSKQRKVLESLALATLVDGASTNDICDVTEMGRGSVLARLSNLLKFGFVAKSSTNPPTYAITKVGLLALGDLSDDLTPLTPLTPLTRPDSFADSSGSRLPVPLTRLTPQIGQGSDRFSHVGSDESDESDESATPTNQDAVPLTRLTLFSKNKKSQDESDESAPTSQTSQPGPADQEPLFGLPIIYP